MSESNSIFIKKDVPISEIKLCLEKILNCQLEKVCDVDWELYSTCLFGLHIALFEANDFVNDRELNLSQFNFLVDLNYLRGEFNEEYESEWRRMASIILGNIISRNLNCECLVVTNMESMVERFLPQN